MIQERLGFLLFFLQKASLAFVHCLLEEARGELVGGEYDHVHDGEGHAAAHRRALRRRAAGNLAHAAPPPAAGDRRRAQKDHLRHVEE